MLEGLIERSRNADRRAEFEAELECPPFPDALTYLWQAFCRLHARRGAGFSVSPLSWSEIDAFIRRAGVRLAPWEIRIIEQIDDAYLAEQGKPKE